MKLKDFLVIVNYQTPNGSLKLRKLKNSSKKLSQIQTSDILKN